MIQLQLPDGIDLLLDRSFYQQQKDVYFKG